MVVEICKGYLVKMGDKITLISIFARKIQENTFNLVTECISEVDPARTRRRDARCHGIE